MRRTTVARQYGKQSKKSNAERMFAELVQTPIREPSSKQNAKQDAEQIEEQLDPLTTSFAEISILESPKKVRSRTKAVEEDVSIVVDELKLRDTGRPKRTSVKGARSFTFEEEISEKTIQAEDDTVITLKEERRSDKTRTRGVVCKTRTKEPVPSIAEEPALRVLTWADVCPPGDQITKIAEASSAEVYRITNRRGTSIIKAIRLASPIKALTKAQVASGLVDEEPHSEIDVSNELQISEWLADIPGFAVYKERYLVKGRTTSELLETHQTVQKKMKREDPGRAQYYPSPSRYLDDTTFLVVELGDAGKSLENWELDSVDQLWDIFLLETIALARAEEVAMFEVRP
jgi:serine/threonine-protein kinase haspin